MRLSPGARWGMLALAILLAGSWALRLAAGPGADQVMRQQWDDTVAATDPAAWLLFIGERQLAADATWNWRQLPEEARHIWASVHFELHLPYPSEPTNLDSGLPTYAEAAAAYEAMDLGEAAILIHTMRNHLPTGQGRPAPAWASSSARLVAMQSRLAAARRAYAQAHRAAIDRLDTGD